MESKRKECGIINTKGRRSIILSKPPLIKYNKKTTLKLFRSKSPLFGFNILFAWSAAIKDLVDVETQKLLLNIPSSSENIASLQIINGQNQDFKQDAA